MHGLIFDIKKFAIHDGPGIRTTVFFKGCCMRCAWCHNPESQNKKQENITRIRRIGKKEFYEEETIGKYYQADEIIDIILEDEAFYQESGGGVTFSGGEPLLQSDFLLPVLIECKRNDVHTAIDTSGNVDPDAFNMVLSFTDLFLFDIKLFDDEMHKKYTGVSNKLILNNFISLTKEDVEIIVRIPIIPGITDTEKNINQLSEFLHGKIERVDLLPYHVYAKNKYERLGRKFSLAEITESETDHIQELSDHFTSSGIIVQIGG